MKKNLMIFGIVGLFAMTLVTASLIVNSFNFSVGVEEPFTVQYAVLGDSGNYDVSVHGTCNDPIGTIDWFSTGETSVPTGNMYPGESRKLCVKIDNAGEAPISYTITSEVVTGLGNYDDCVNAFPEESFGGLALGQDTIIDGMDFTVPGDAPAVNDCEVVVNVARG